MRRKTVTRNNHSIKTLILKITDSNLLLLIIVTEVWHILTLKSIILINNQLLLVFLSIIIIIISILLVIFSVIISVCYFTSFALSAVHVL